MVGSVSLYVFVWTERSARLLWVPQTMKRVGKTLKLL
jgi:hypothetical protein